MSTVVGNRSIGARPFRQYQISLAAVPESVRGARNFFLGVADEFALRPDDVAMGAVAVSDLVTSAVVHTHDPVVVRARTIGDGVCIEVLDQSGHDILEADRERTDGRGLAFVEAITEAWGSGVDPQTGSSTAWFVLRSAA